jgi:GTP-binding protein
MPFTPCNPGMLRTVSFTLSVAEPSQLPPEGGPEVAFSGRSNAGKSSAINAICGRHKLAFVSRTPGRTQVINFYRVGGDAYLVDLPGYGYARVPFAVRARWERLLGAYLRTRHCLRGVFVVMDARHPLTELDRTLLEWLAPTHRPVEVLLAKADKLTRPVAERQLGETVQALARLYPGAGARLFSSVDGTGVEEARDRLARWLGLEEDQRGGTPFGGRRSAAKRG